MAFKEVRDEIETILKDVAKIGKVHAYRRHSTFWDEYFRDHVEAGQINTWEITRTATAQELINVQGSVGTEPYFHDTHSVLIIGRMALKDDEKSEQDFQELVDSVVAKFRVNNLLNNKVLLPKQAQVLVIEHRTFGGILVHYCEITFEAVERVGG